MKARTSIIVIFLLFIAGVCHSENHVITLSTTLNDTILNISPKLSFETSEQIKEAIDNGIRIQLIAKAQLFIPRKWWFDETLENKKTSLEVFYFTLGKLYVIKDKETGEQLGFNDYEQLWKDFEKLIKFQFEAPKNNKTSVKLRIMLDKSALPTVMQLPILFNSDWDINTPWFQQEVTPQ
jgi:hypothetical protein